MRYALPLLFALAAGPPATAAPVELLTSGGFESGANDAGRPVGWTVVEGDVRLVGGLVHAGGWALEATDPGPGPAVSVESERRPCQAGAVYVATTWLRAEGDARPSFYLQFFSETGQRIGVVAQFAPQAADWVSVALAALAPREARTVSVLVFSGSAEAGTFQADDISLMEWSAGDVGVDRGVVNAGFEVLPADEDLPPGWQGATGGARTDGGSAHAGAHSLRLPDEASIRSAWCPARPGQKWAASAWAKASGDTRAVLAVEFVDGFLRPVGAVEDHSKATDWAEVAVEGVAPAGTSGALVRLSAEAGTVWMDDVSLFRVAKEGPAVVDIGQNRQLFVDDYLIDEMSALERIFHRPTKEPAPVIVPDRPWEESSFLGIVGNSVLYDEEAKQYRMYYIIYQMIGLSERQHFAVAVSDDGLNWTKPELGVADFRGSKANNLLVDYESPRYAEELFFYTNVIYDRRDPDPARRYKSLGFLLNHKTGARGTTVSFSPDGLHFTDAPENPVLPNGDTNTLLGWDDRIGKYVAYPRTDGPTSARDIGYSTSDDFIHWTPTQTVMEPIAGDPPHFEIYGMPVVKYEGLYLGFPWAFIAAGLEPLDTQLAVSRDGVTWQRDPNAPMFIPRGPAGAFDDSYAITANPIVVGDEILFYYMACGFPHGYAFTTERKFEGAIGLARLRLDGFASLSCFADSGGHVVTRPLTFAGRRMVVNCGCERGWLRVELQREDGTPIPGFAEADCDPISTDAIRQPVTWHGNADVSALAGTPIRVRIVVGDGEVYSFGFAE